MCFPVNSLLFLFFVSRTECYFGTRLQSIYLYLLYHTLQKKSTPLKTSLEKFRNGLKIFSSPIL